MKTCFSTKSRRLPRCGFSLVELLITISVIGVIAALIVTSVSSIYAQAQESKDMRNAQSAVQTFNAARSSGVVFASDTLDGVITEMMNGRYGQGLLAGKVFSLGQMTSSDITSMKLHLNFTPPSAPGAGDQFLKIGTPN